MQESQLGRNNHKDLERRWSVNETKRSSRNPANLSHRLSVGSKRLSDSWEYQGWGDQTSPPATKSNACRPTSQVQFDIETTISESREPRVAAQHLDRPTPEDPEPKYGFRFWMVILALCVTQLLNAFEGTVTSTALPTIVEQLGGGNEFIWASSGYFLTR